MFNHKFTEWKNMNLSAKSNKAKEPGQNIIILVRRIMFQDNLTFLNMITNTLTYLILFLINQTTKKIQISAKSA